MASQPLVRLAAMRDARPGDEDRAVAGDEDRAVAAAATVGEPVEVVRQGLTRCPAS